MSKEPSRLRWNRVIVYAAWAMYALSFALISYGPARGFHCATLQKFMLRKASQHDRLAIHYELLTLPNILMLLSPLLLWWFGRKLFCIWFLRITIFISSIVVWWFLVEIYNREGLVRLREGAFVWASSFVVLFVGLLFKSGRQGTSGGERRRSRR